MVSGLGAVLLGILAEGKFPALLLRSSSFLDSVRMRGCRASEEDVLNSVIELAELGLVSFTRAGQVCFSVSRAEIDEEITSEDAAKLWEAHTEVDSGKENFMWLGLTDGGGGEWESLASPRWEACFEYCLIPNRLNRLVAASEQRLWELVKEHERQFGQSAEPASGDWTIVEIRPWDVFYWKTLPVGYAVEYRCASKRRIRHAMPIFEPWFKELRCL